MRVSVDEANDFARWLHCQLPTARQWDKAGGRFDGAIGPYPGDGAQIRNEDAGVGLRVLQPVSRSGAPESLFHCRDMAGNGYEWTCSVAADETELVPFSNPGWNERVSLRGMTYFAPRPYRFADRPNKRYRIKDPQGESGASAEVGFRVVLPLPATP
jgi:formylglycine-generating enzyme required for sulfatase activity